MGAAAITTSGFEIDRARVAELLGFSGPLQNSYSCIAAVDYVTASYGAIELMFLHLGRPIQDFQVWSSFEVGQLYVPNALVQISSIMPQKRNPVPIEHLRHLASQTMARARAMLDVMHNTPFTDMNDSEGETQADGLSGFRCRRARTRPARSSRFAGRNRSSPRCGQYRRSCITITELADSLVREEGLSFRQAHEIASAVARAVVAEGGELGANGYAPFCAAFEKATGRTSGIGAERFADIVSPEHFVAVRTRYGGPAGAPLQAAIDGYRSAAQGFAQRAKAHATHIAAASAELNTRFSELIEDA